MSFPRYPEYRDSGVRWLREVPAHWDVAHGRRLFRQMRDGALPDDPQLSATQKYGVIPQIMFMELEDQRVAQALSGTGSFKHVSSGDFVISLRSFQGGIELSRYDGCVSPAYTVLRSSAAVCSGYFAAVMKSATFISALQSMTDGMRDGKAIGFEAFGVLGLPVPPLFEQRQIAAALHDLIAPVDTLISEQQRLIELLKEKLQATITRAVTKGLDPDAPMKSSGVEWIGDVPAHWSISALKRKCDIFDCKHITADFVEIGIPLVSIREVKGRWISLGDAKRTTPEFHAILAEGERKPRSGDLIFSRNATVGEVSQVPEECDTFAMGQDVCLLRTLANAADPDFVQLVLRSSTVRTQLDTLMIGSTFKRVNVEQIGNMVLPVPPTGEQKRIAVHLRAEEERIDFLTANASRAVALLQERRAALISAAVTGKIDVRHLAKPDTEAA